MALLSVLMPVRNAEPFLAEALESLRSQTLKDIEVIVVDDNSSDASLRIAKEFETKDARFKTYRSCGKGIVDALQQAEQCSSAEIIARMDADDVSHPQRLELQYQYLVGRDYLGLVSCCVEQIGEGDHNGFLDYITWSNTLRTSRQIRDAQFIESPIVHPSVCFRRACITEHGSWRNGDFPEDYELWLRWLAEGVCFEKLPETLLAWRHTETRLTRRDERYSRDAFFRVKSPFVAEWTERNRNERRILVIGAGRRARKRAGMLRECGVEVSAWVEVDARRFGRSFDGISVIGLQELPQPEECIVLNYVGTPGARRKIDGLLCSHGFRIGKDYMHIT